jgi:hypothetical protein
MRKIAVTHTATIACPISILKGVLPSITHSMAQRMQTTIASNHQSWRSSVNSFGRFMAKIVGERRCVRKLEAPQHPGHGRHGLRKQLVHLCFDRLLAETETATLLAARVRNDSPMFANLLDFWGLVIVFVFLCSPSSAIIRLRC